VLRDVGGCGVADRPPDKLDGFQVGQHLAQETLPTRAGSGGIVVARHDHGQQVRRVVLAGDTVTKLHSDVGEVQ